MATQQRIAATPLARQQSALPTALTVAKSAQVSTRPVLSTEQKVLQGLCTTDVDTTVVGKEYVQKILAREALMKKLSMKGRRRGRRRGHKTEYHRGANADQRMALFGMDGSRLGPVGGRATRVYEFVLNTANTAAGVTSEFFNFGLRQLAGVHSLAIYRGRAVPGVGVDIEEAGRFPEESKLLCQLFKWMNVDSIEMQIIPVINEKTQLTEGAPIELPDDSGVVYFGAHDGDESIYNPVTGAATIGYQEVQMLSHKTFKPVSEHSKMIAAKPIVPLVLTNDEGDQITTFPRMRPIRTLVFNQATNDEQYPFSGFWQYWYAPNLVGDGVQGRYFYDLKFKVQISWNTVQDTILSTVPPSEEKFFEDLNNKLAGAPMPTFAPGTKPPVYPQDPLGLNTKIDDDQKSQVSVDENYIKIKK